MKKIVFLFPGQGSQYVGMGKELCENFSEARLCFEQASEVLGYDLMKMCHEGDLKELTKTEITQPAILTASIAAFRVYIQEFDVKPELCAGHSLGEISALTCSGAIAFPDAVKIVQKRGQYMQQAVSSTVGAMAAVNSIALEHVQRITNEISRANHLVVISNINSPQQIVISGHKEAVYEASEQLKKLEAKIIPLNVSAPFHSPLMKPAADKLRDELSSYTFHDLLYPVMSNALARPYNGSDEIITNLSQQLVDTVRWQETMEYMTKIGVEVAIELGPKNVLCNLMRKGAKTIKPFSYDDRKDIEKLNTELQEEGSLSITLITKCMAAAVCTKNMNWNDDEYQTGVVQPYSKMQGMQTQVEQSNKKPSLEDMIESLNLLKEIFETKRVPLDEQVERFNTILEEAGTEELFKKFEMPQ